MPKDINYSLSRYIEAFSRIRRAAEQHSYLWNGAEEGLELLRIGIDELQNWVESYGLLKGRDGKLHFYKKRGDRDDSHLIPIKEIAKDFQRHNNHGCNLSLSEISTRFVDGIGEYLRKYGIAKVEKKVKREVQALEKIVFLDSEI